MSKFHIEFTAGPSEVKADLWLGGTIPPTLPCFPPHVQVWGSSSPDVVVPVYRKASVPADVDLADLTAPVLFKPN